MSRDPRHEPEQTPLDPRDARFVTRLRDAYDPGPLVPARRAAFDEALRQRLAGRARVPGWPVFAGGLAAAALAALVVLRAPEPAPPPAPEVAVRATPAAESAPRASAPESQAPRLPAAWARTLLLAEESGADAVDTDPRENLPPSYAAVAGLFLDR